MLNSFVGELLPKDASSVFGQGTAGEMWRSMLAEQVSLQIAKSGKLGLARRLFATHELSRPRRVGASGRSGEGRRRRGANERQHPLRPRRRRA